MNMRGDRGFVGDKRMYNSILLEFIPADYKVKTVDLSGPFALEGAANELGVYQFCIKGHGVLVYDLSGPRHIDYTCTLPDQICIAGSCRKNIRGPTAITSETSFIRNGDEFHLKGKATAAYSIADSQRSISLTELIDFSIAKDGTCSLINYRKESHSEEHYVTESPYNHPDPPSTIVTQSEAGASCDIFKNPMGQ